MRKGITIIEVLLVISLIAILGASSTPFLSRFVLQTNLDAAVEALVSSIRKAQEYAMDGKNGSVWGVCRSANVIRLYSGSCASPTAFEDYSVPSTVSVENLGNALFDIRGEPSNPLLVTVKTRLESVTVGVNQAGGINVD